MMDISDYVCALMQAENAIIETELEKALQGGSCGVKVLRTRLGAFVSASVDIKVPYGVIHEYRTADEQSLR